eukprot:3653684-Pleurochrysis_carterae.AAC.2
MCPPRLVPPAAIREAAAAAAAAGAKMRQCRLNHQVGNALALEDALAAGNAAYAYRWRNLRLSVRAHARVIVCASSEQGWTEPRRLEGGGPRPLGKSVGR